MLYIGFNIWLINLGNIIISKSNSLFYFINNIFDNIDIKKI